MPAAAVIPAPVAYIKAVAVKKLVVEFRNGACGPPRRGHCSIPVPDGGVVGVGRGVPVKRPSACRAFGTCSYGARRGVSMLLTAASHVVRPGYFEKIRVFKAGLPSLDNVAWNNGIGPTVLLSWFSVPR